jgi:hypothetical protein
MPSVRIGNLGGAMGTFFLGIATSILLGSYAYTGSGTLTVSGTQWGVTLQYLGANETSMM